MKATEEYEEHQKIAGDDMIAAREKFRQLEEQERLNPNNMLIRILVICTYNFYEDRVLEAARARYGIAEV